MDIHVLPIPIPPPTSLSTRSLWVFPVHQVWALVSCIQATGSLNKILWNYIVFKVWSLGQQQLYHLAVVQVAGAQTQTWTIAFEIRELELSDIFFL